jgi:hypothetical protein
VLGTVNSAKKNGQNNLFSKSKKHGQIGTSLCALDYCMKTAYIVDACALTSLLPSLSLIDMTYCKADTKATPESVQGVDVDF